MTNPSPETVAMHYIPVRKDWLDRHHEEVLEPDLPIVDPARFDTGLVRDDCLARIRRTYAEGYVLPAACHADRQPIGNLTT